MLRNRTVKYLRGLLVVLCEFLLHVEGRYGGHTLEGGAQQTCRASSAIKTLLCGGESNVAG